MILLAFSTEDLLFGYAHWGNSDFFSLAFPTEWAKTEVLECRRAQLFLILQEGNFSAIGTEILF